VNFTLQSSSHTIVNHFSLFYIEKCFKYKLFILMRLHYQFFCIMSHFAEELNSFWTGDMVAQSELRLGCGGDWDIFSLPSCLDWLWGPLSLLSNGKWGSFLQNKMARAWSWPPPSSVNVKNAQIYTSTLQYIIIAWCLIKWWMYLHGMVHCHSQIVELGCHIF
jgi:hypothetical protein